MTRLSRRCLQWQHFASQILCKIERGLLALVPDHAEPVPIRIVARAAVPQNQMAGVRYGQGAVRR